jgi:hypothetical protein
MSFNAFGSVTFTLTVFVSAGDTAMPARPKRVRLATVWCDYEQCHEVVAGFKRSNPHLLSADLRAEFTVREHLDCDFVEVER